MRSTEEPETSLIRARDLDSFMRRCEAFCLDHGHETGESVNDQVENFRQQFEALLGKDPPSGYALSLFYFELLFDIVLFSTAKSEDKSKQVAAV